MKIAIVSLDNSDRIMLGGKHVHQQQLKRALEKMGHSVVTIFPARSAYYLLVRLTFTLLNKLGLLNKGRIFEWTLEYMCESLRRKVQNQSEDLDVIFSQDPVSAVAARKGTQQKSIPLLMTLHGYLSLESVNYGFFNPEERALVMNHARKFEIKALEAAHKVITVDTRISKYLQSEFNYQRPHTILRNAVDPEPFSKVLIEQIEAEKRQLNIPADKRIILVPRRLVKKNGVHVALKTLAGLKEKGRSDFFLLIMGNGPEFANLQSLKSDLRLDASDILFLGDVDHKLTSKYYSMADIVLIPSVVSDGIEEATSLSMLEGMAAKKTVIVSDIGGMKEVIRHGINGFLFQENDHNELTQLLIELSGSPSGFLDKVASQGYADVCKNHHYERHAEAYLSQLPTPLDGFK